MKAGPPRLGITMGDPAGVGPEVTALALAAPETYDICRPLVLGDETIMKAAAGVLGLVLRFRAVFPGEDFPDEPGVVPVVTPEGTGPLEYRPGRPERSGARAAALCIETGARLALGGRIHGLVTSPISKEALNDAGYHYPGHTQFLARLAGDPDVVMMLAGPKLRVVLVTIHVALADVPGLLSAEKILRTTEITDRALKRDFGLARPRLAAAGLNPHAGESGMFGCEEETVIRPAVEEARRRGIDLSGPYPPDTLFYRAVNGEFDAVVCMYHDQGLIPLKLLHFKDGVNVTLGLPFIRTSVDHGTAYEIAGRGTADPSSMAAAIRLAAKMAEARQAERDAG